MRKGFDFKKNINGTSSWNSPLLVILSKLDPPHYAFICSSASILIGCFNVGDTRTEKEEEEASEPFRE